MLTVTFLGKPCNAEGTASLAPHSDPPPPYSRPPDDYTPFENAAHFKIADFLFTKEQMSGGKTNELMDLWYEWNALGNPTSDSHPDVPFVNKDDLYATIDAIEQGDVLWESFGVTYAG